jgi:hypothetical protein
MKDDPNYILIRRPASNEELEMLYEHTRSFRESKRFGSAQEGSSRIEKIMGIKEGIRRPSLETENFETKQLETEEQQQDHLCPKVDPEIFQRLAWEQRVDNRGIFHSFEGFQIMTLQYMQHRLIKSFSDGKGNYKLKDWDPGDWDDAITDLHKYSEFNL